MATRKQKKPYVNVPPTVPRDDDGVYGYLTCTPPREVQVVRNMVHALRTLVDNMTVGVFEVPERATYREDERTYERMNRRIMGAKFYQMNASTDWAMHGDTGWEAYLVIGQVFRALEMLASIPYELIEDVLARDVNCCVNDCHVQSS